MFIDFGVLDSIGFFLFASLSSYNRKSWCDVSQTNQEETTWTCWSHAYAGLVCWIESGLFKKPLFSDFGRVEEGRWCYIRGYLYCHYRSPVWIWLRSYRSRVWTVQQHSVYPESRQVEYMKISSVTSRGLGLRLHVRRPGLSSHLWPGISVLHVICFIIHALLAFVIVWINLLWNVKCIIHKQFKEHLNKCRLMWRETPVWWCLRQEVNKKT